MTGEIKEFGRRNPSTQVGGAGRSCPARGWTIVEMMLVLTIIATLSTIAVPIYTRAKKEAQEQSASEDLRQVGMELDIYLAKHGKLPDSLALIGRAALLDPWGNPYQYLPVAGASPGKLRKDLFLVPINSDYDLYSMGPDGKSSPALTAKSSRDDIIRANDGAYFGIAEEY